MAEGRLTTSELDERLQTVYAAKTFGELEPLTADLPVPAPLPLPTAPAVDVSSRFGGTPTGSSSIAVMSEANRQGVWVVPDHYNVVAVMGGSNLDLSDARFTSHETVISVFAFWGGVDIRVPEDIDVRVEGVGFMGAFENHVRDNDPPSGAPVVRVVGLAIMAGVDVKRPQRRRRRDREEIGE